MSSICTIVSERPCFMFYATRHQVYWALTHCSFLLVLWFDIINAKRHAALTGANRLKHSQKIYIYDYINTIYYVLTEAAYYDKQIICYIKNLLNRILICLCISKTRYSLVEVIYLSIIFNKRKTKFFLWNSKNTDRNGKNKLNTYTHILRKT